MGFSMKVTWKGPDLKDMKVNAKAIEDFHLELGYVESSELGFIATIHEFGCRQTTTERQRRFLYAVKKFTRVPNELVIPARPFLSNGFEKYAAVQVEQVAPMQPAVISGAMPMETFLKAIGEPLASKMTNYVSDNEGNFKPLKKITIMNRRGKKGARPLVDTGHMANAITSKVVKG